MKFKADPKQRFLVLSMAFGETPAEREPTFGALNKRKVTVAKRKELELAGVCKTEKRGRSQHLLLDKGASQFVLQNLGESLPASPSAGKILARVLGLLKPLLEGHDISVDELLGKATSARGEPPRSIPSESTPPERLATEKEIRDACLFLAGGQIGKRIRLADLRHRVPASRESLDDMLKSMQQAGRLVLFKMDNPAEITPDDERAALVIAGHPRHLVYLEA